MSDEIFTDWRIDEYESFDFLGISFDIQEAKRILLARPRPNKKIEVKNYAALLEMQSGLGTPKSKIDLNVPVICLAVGKGSFPIDGWNRILTAVQNNKDTLPCIRLTDHECARIRRIRQ
jgi:hypothetical protein